METPSVEFQAHEPKIQVIGAGPGRTGTASLKEALEILGYGPCYHMFECVKLGHERQWSKAFSSEEVSRETWHNILQGFGSAVDFPACAAYEQLLAAFPGAKVILTTRNRESWARSVRKTIWNSYGPEISWNYAFWRYHFQQMTKKMRQRFFGDERAGVRGTSIVSDEVLMSAFDEWNQRVKKTVPSEKLLIFRVEEGWEPLCKFLGVPVPETSFPRVNDTAEFSKNIKKQWWIHMGLNVATGVFLVAVVLFALR
uniref:Nad dependent epimerase dehydratase n=1 Tax=Tetraselmis sp. GSL018 TaxID=582737 RepID=A0A061SB03_9CHLO